MDILLNKKNIYFLDKYNILTKSREQFLQEIIDENKSLSIEIKNMKKENDKIIFEFNEFVTIEIGIYSPYKINKIELYLSNNSIYKTINEPVLINENIYSLERLLTHRIPIIKYILYYENNSIVDLINDSDIKMIFCVCDSYINFAEFIELYYS
jgi:hypothetical protein